MKKRIAVVTGASSGMGRETALELSDRFSGLDEIWLIARREDRLWQLAGKLTCRAKVLPMDLAKDSELSLLAGKLREEKPEVKILVNAAGFGKIGKIGNLPAEDERGMIDLNIGALTAVTRIVLPYMDDGGRILNYASSAAFLPQPGFGIYAATKAFVLSYSRALGVELRSRRIGVTAVCPGPVKTEFFDIAETYGKVPIYKKLIMAKPERVVRLAIRDMTAGQAVSTYGLPMKAFRVFCKLVPHSVILRLWNRVSPETVEVSREEG